MRWRRISWSSTSLACVSVVPLGLAQAATVRVAYQLGRSEPSAARRAAYVALAMGVLFMTAAALLLWTTPRILIGFYLDLGEAARTRARWRLRYSFS